MGSYRVEPSEEHICDAGVKGSHFLANESECHRRVAVMRLARRRRPLPSPLKIDHQLLSSAPHSC